MLQTLAGTKLVKMWEAASPLGVGEVGKGGTPASARCKKNLSQRGTRTKSPLRGERASLDAMYDIYLTCKENAEDEGLRLTHDGYLFTPISERKEIDRNAPTPPNSIQREMASCVKRRITLFLSMFPPVADLVRNGFKG